MKKYLSILCTMVLLSTICGCSSDADTSSSSESSNVSETTSKISVDEDTTEENSEFTTEPTTAKATEASTETSAIETTTEATTEASPETQTSITSTSDFVSAIGQQIEITDIIPMAAEMIGAVEGTSFKYNGNKFEIYYYNENDPKLTEASYGTITYTIEGFGDFSLNATVNGNYIMAYDTVDDTVIQTFLNVK